VAVAFFPVYFCLWPSPLIVFLFSTQALQAVHSKRVAICNLTAAKVVKYGKVWKILGLEHAHKEGEMFGNRIMVPGAPQSLSGIVWSPENSCDTPESVAAWATVCTYKYPHCCAPCHLQCQGKLYIRCAALFPHVLGVNLRVSLPLPENGGCAQGINAT
jgi:hypothetical protein